MELRSRVVRADPEPEPAPSVRSAPKLQLAPESPQPGPKGVHQLLSPHVRMLDQRRASTASPNAPRVVRWMRDLPSEGLSPPPVPSPCPSPRLRPLSTPNSLRRLRLFTPNTRHSVRSEDACGSEMSSIAGGQAAAISPSRASTSSEHVFPPAWHELLSRDKAVGSAHSSSSGVPSPTARRPEGVLSTGQAWVAGRPTQLFRRPPPGVSKVVNTFLHSLSVDEKDPAAPSTVRTAGDPHGSASPLHPQIALGPRKRRKLHATYGRSHQAPRKVNASDRMTLLHQRMRKSDPQPSPREGDSGLHKGRRTRTSLRAEAAAAAFSRLDDEAEVKLRPTRMSPSNSRLPESSEAGNVTQGSRALLGNGPAPSRPRRRVRGRRSALPRVTQMEESELTRQQIDPDVTGVAKTAMEGMLVAECPVQGAVAQLGDPALSAGDDMLPSQAHVGSDLTTVGIIIAERAQVAEDVLGAAAQAQPAGSTSSPLSGKNTSAASVLHSIPGTPTSPVTSCAARDHGVPALMEASVHSEQPSKRGGDGEIRPSSCTDGGPSAAAEHVPHTPNQDERALMSAEALQAYDGLDTENAAELANNQESGETELIGSVANVEAGNPATDPEPATHEALVASQGQEDKTLVGAPRLARKQYDPSDVDLRECSPPRAKCAPGTDLYVPYSAKHIPLSGHGSGAEMVSSDLTVVVPKVEEFDEQDLGPEYDDWVEAYEQEQQDLLEMEEDEICLV